MSETIRVHTYSDSISLIAQHLVELVLKFVSPCQRCQLYVPPLHLLFALGLTFRILLPSRQLLLRPPRYRTRR